MGWAFFFGENMARHADLTGADLHEPKGVSSASANTVYVANGSGTGTWKTIDASAIDPVSIKNINYMQLVVRVSDLVNSSIVVVPVPQNATLLAATSCITAAISGGDSTLTFSRAGAATIGTITIAASGSGEGILDTLTTPANNVFTAPSYLKITSDGNPTGGTSDAYIVLEFSLN